jgi:ABC-type protease/lipase transport system fused ATPase/permease subunit
MFFYEKKEGSYNVEYKYGNIFLVVIFLFIFFIGFMWGGHALMRVYGVWSQEMRGKADLAEAQWNRQIAIQEAEARLESEKLNAQSEIERAKGMAEAIKIEGGQLTTQYIQYLWVRSNNFNENTTIYVPTEVNLPILEANRLNK